QVKFTKRIYYPNISGRGSIDVDFIRDQCTSGIYQLLRDPNPECDLMPKISKTDRNRYKATAREWTRKYA
ncbi:hypothetical protein RhiirA5_242625, partial [Rhizophagus irregularis]